MIYQPPLTVLTWIFNYKIITGEKFVSVEYNTIAYMVTMVCSIALVAILMPVGLIGDEDESEETKENVPEETK